MTDRQTDRHHNGRHRTTLKDRQASRQTDRQAGRQATREEAGTYREVCLLGRGGQAALTLQREWVRWRGELMSLGVDERSPSAAEASEMIEGWRE